ncbi:MAG: FGGY family carbohydrate kinase [Candidatus Poribacteria bacterium]|nr:FGGY family carbohydrate kinase [Candidatus Poribacteria bacterium]MDE0506022.1 FGGY family carbohydrate kinase [Candidatus Poribacteria bacterium]
MKCLGIDIGTSSIKGAALNLEDCTVSEVIKEDFPAPITGLPTGHIEVDPSQIQTAVECLLTKLLAIAPDVSSVHWTGQMGGVILADEAGNALTNYVSWRDQRTLERYPARDASFFQILERRLTKSRMEELGNDCKPGSALSLLFWLAVQAELHESAIPLALPDYVCMRLCDAEPVTEYTSALGTLNVEKNLWHREAFEELGVDKLRWPQLIDPYQAVGALMAHGNVIPSYPSVGDHQCALAGMRLQKNELSINVSTGSQIGVLAKDYQPGDYQVRPYFDRQYLKALTHLPAGRSLNVLVDLLCEIPHGQGIEVDDPWLYITKAASDAKTDLDVDLAFFEGPMGSRGEIRNIKVENLNVGTLFRAAFDNMADNYEGCASRLVPKGDWNGIVLSGGLISNCDILRRLIEERFDCPVRLSGAPEETMEGLLVLAQVAHGRFSSVAEASAEVECRQQAHCAENKTA